MKLRRLPLIVAFFLLPLAFFLLPPRAAFATCYCVDPVAAQCRCSAPAASVPEAKYDGNQGGVKVKCTSQAEANSTFEKKNPICGSASETIPSCAPVSYDPSRYFCYGRGFIPAAAVDDKIKDIPDHTWKVVNGSFNFNGSFGLDSGTYNVYVCNAGVFCCGQPGGTCDDSGVPKGGSCTPQDGPGNPGICENIARPGPVACNQIRADEPHPLRPNPGAACIDEPNWQSRLSCASDFEMRRIIDDPAAKVNPLFNPDADPEITDKTIVGQTEIIKKIFDPIASKIVDVKQIEKTVSYTRVVKNIDFKPEINHLNLDYPIAGVASRSCRGPAPAKDCFADKLSDPAKLSNYTSWYHQGIVDPQQAEKTLGSNRANLLAAEMDEFFDLGIIGYLVWQYSGSLESPLDNDPFSFFKQDPICEVMKEKSTQIGADKFVGTNMHSLANYDVGVINDSLSYLSSQCGASVVRIWGSPDRGGPQAVKKVLDIAQNYGIKIIVVIADYSNSSGDILPGPIRSNPTSWYNSEYQAAYLPYVQNMANAIRGHPALYAYELANEAHCSGHAECIAPYARWANQVSLAIKSIDPVAKIGIGQKASEDTTRGDSPTPGDFTYSNSPSSIGITSGHYYPINSPNEKTLVRAAKSQADVLGKPFYIGEAGIPADQDSETGDTPQLVDWLTLLGPIRKLIPKEALDARKNWVIDQVLAEKSYNQIIAYARAGSPISRQEAIRTGFDQIVRIKDMTDHRNPDPADIFWYTIWNRYMPFTANNDLPGRIFTTISNREINDPANKVPPRLVITQPNYDVFFPHAQETDIASDILQSIFRPPDLLSVLTYDQRKSQDSSAFVSENFYDPLKSPASLADPGYDVYLGKGAPRPPFDANPCNVLARANTGDILHDETTAKKEETTIKAVLRVTKPVVFTGKFLYDETGTVFLGRSGTVPPRGPVSGIVSVYVQNPPQAENVWERLVRGPAAVFKALFPLPNEDDTPSQSNNLGYYCGPDCQVVSDRQTRFPHWGSILELFHQKIQDMLNPLISGLATPGQDTAILGTDYLTANYPPNLLRQIVVPSAENIAALLEKIKIWQTQPGNTWIGSKFEENYQKIIDFGAANNLNPALLLSLYLEETHAEAFGDFPLGCGNATTLDASLDCLANDDAIDQYRDAPLAEFMCRYADGHYPCNYQNHPNFIKNLFEFYNQLTP